MNGPALPRWGNEARDRKALAIWLTLVNACGRGIANGRWLDVGCGSGGIAAGLAPRVRSMTGIDPEPWPGWAEAETTGDNLRFLVGRFDGVNLPVAAASADVVLCNQVYEHVADPQQLLSNIYRALAPGGVCYFAGPNLLWPIEPHVFWPFVHWLPRSVAHSVMRMLGSPRAEELDAFSRSYWTLASWFHASGFACRWIGAERLRAELDARGLARTSSAVGYLVPTTPLVAPFFPGFAFVLTKAS